MSKHGDLSVTGLPIHGQPNAPPLPETPSAIGQTERQHVPAPHQVSSTGDSSQSPLLKHKRFPTDSDLIITPLNKKHVNFIIPDMASLSLQKEDSSDTAEDFWPTPDDVSELRKDIPEQHEFPGVAGHAWSVAHEHMSRHAKFSMRALLTKDLATNSKPPMWAFGGQRIPAHFFPASRAGPFYSLLRRQAKDRLNCLTAILKSEADYCQRVTDAQLDTCARMIEETDDAELLPKLTKFRKSTLLARALRQVTKLRDSATTFSDAELSAALVEETDGFTTVSTGHKQPSNRQRSRSRSPHARRGPRSPNRNPRESRREPRHRDNHDNKGPHQQRQPKRTPFSASNNNTKRGHSQHKDNASGFHVACRDSLTALINDAVQTALANKK